MSESVATLAKNYHPRQAALTVSDHNDLMHRAFKVQKIAVVAIEGLTYLSTRVKGDENRKILLEIADEAKDHLAYLEEVTGKDAGPCTAAIRRFKAEARILGFMFAIRKLLNAKQFSTAFYQELAAVDPVAEMVYANSVRHVEKLTNLLDEERLHYVGAMVLGLNDALVEITGALAGVTFSLCNTKVVALTGIVTGISATISMAASNYLAVREDGDKDAVKSAIFTGGAYAIAVVLLVLPYLLLPDAMYAPAFFIMIAEVILILVAFNYYLSVANNTKFWKRFGQMAIISLGVAAIAFLIGLAAKELLGITVG